MRNRISIFIFVYLFSCNIPTHDNNGHMLKQWILKNEKELNLTCDSIINEYYKEKKTDSNWISSSLIVTEFAPNLLGTLAAMAGDSTECIVIELTFYKDPAQKKNILISAEDSSCLPKLKTINLDKDSTEHLVFGKRTEAVY